MNARAPVDILEQQPLGKAMWIRGAGTSMRPLIRSGDSLRVRRCDARELSVGDIALMRLPEGKAFAHLVVSTAPLRTSTFLGQLDADGAQVVGRVEALRRFGVVLPLPKRARWPLMLLHRAAARAYSAWSGSS
jgi:mycothiol synthase